MVRNPILKGCWKKMSSSPQFTVDDQAVRQDFDLSQNRSLRTLETTAETMVCEDTSPNFLTTVLSTITSPLPLTIVIIYGERDVDLLLCTWAKPFRVESLRQETRTANVVNHQERFTAFSEMYKVREFQLVLCADVLERVVECAMGVLERIVEAEKANGGLGYFLSEPLIISERRSPRTRLRDDRVGRRRWSIDASAL
jgi:hypothetical protein